MERLQLSNLKYAEEVKQLREMTLEKMMGQASKINVE